MEHYQRQVLTIVECFLERTQANPGRARKRQFSIWPKVHVIYGWLRDEYINQKCCLSLQHRQQKQRKTRNMNAARRAAMQSMRVAQVARASASRIAAARSAPVASFRTSAVAAGGGGDDHHDHPMFDVRQSKADLHLFPVFFPQ